MRRIFACIAILLCLAGCSAKQRYIEGTSLSLGAYLPFEESIYGIELVQYTSGAILCVSTNQPIPNYEREYSATNSYFWGMVQTIEHSKSKIKAER